MKFKEYLDNLKKFAEDNPESLEKDVIYAKDDEGNGFQYIGNSITLGYFDGEYHGEFYSDKEDYEEYFEEPMVINAICIN